MRGGKGQLCASQNRPSEISLWRYATCLIPPSYSAKQTAAQNLCAALAADVEADASSTLLSMQAWG